MKTSNEKSWVQRDRNDCALSKEHTIRIELEGGAPIKEITGALSRTIGGILANEAMMFPVHVAALACNGAGYIMRFVPRDNGNGGGVDYLAEHEEPSGVMLPIHALVMDSDGHTIRVIVAEKGLMGA